MKKAYIGLAAAVTAAAGAAAYFIVKKKDTGAAPAAAGKRAEIKNPATAEYSFVSGYNDAKTVKAGFTYDGDKFSYKVIEEEFLAYTDNSHVGALYGEEYNLQIEYTDFVTGENFEKHSAYLEEKYKGFAKTEYGKNSGCMYYDGDGTCFVFPATEFSCILITVLLGKNSKLQQEDLPSDADLSMMLESLEIC